MTILTRLDDSFKQSSVHGLSHYANSTNRYFKIFWSLMTLTCLSSMLYFITVRLQDFSMATVTTSLDKIKQDSLEFPKITICSLNSMDDADNDFSYYVMKEQLGTHLWWKCLSEPEVFMMFLIDFMSFRIELRRLEIETLRSPYSARHQFYSKNVLIPTLVQAPDLYYVYWNEPSLVTDRCYRGNGTETLEKLWQKYISPCEEWLLAEEALNNLKASGGPGSSNLGNSSPSDLGIKYEMPDEWLQFKMNYICKRLDTHNFTDAEKCKYVTFGPMVEERHRMEELAGEIASLHYLTSEIVYGFLNEGDTDSQMENYGPYFQDMISDFDTDAFFDEVSSGAHITTMKTLYHNVTDFIFGPEHEYHNNITFASIMHIMQIYKGLQIEMVFKDSWMTSLTNIDHSNTVKPDIFIADLGMIQWYYKQPNNPDITQQKIPNFKITERNEFFKTFNPDYSVMNFYYSGKKYENNSEIWEPYYSPKSSTCFRLKDNVNFHQENSGANAFYAVLFTGYVGYSLSPINWALHTTSKFEVSIDLPKSCISDITTSPIVFENNKLTKIGLTQIKTEQSSQFRDCDDNPATTPFKECKQKCFVESIFNSPECQCIPIFGINFFEKGYFDYKYHNFTTYKEKLEATTGIKSSAESFNDFECTYEQLSNLNCYNFIMNFKNLTSSEIETQCSCHEPCRSTKYDVAIQTTNSGLTRMEYELAYSRDYDKFIQAGNMSQNIQNWFTSSYDSQRKYVQRTLKGYSMNKGVNLQSLMDDDTVVSSGVALLQIYYDSLTVNSLKESEADKASSLVSDLGGQLGLWLGISMVSLMEMTVCIYACVGGSKCFGRIRRPKKINTCDKDQNDNGSDTSSQLQGCDKLAWKLDKKVKNTGTPDGSFGRDFLTTQVV